uniref:N-acetyltransferase domain-containing protein n=1 Tax=viral metagenome TaxID=1070528 RepID=A0A6C0KNI8_9ZZZZ
MAIIRRIQPSDKEKIKELSSYIFRAEDELPLLQKALQQCNSDVSFVAVEGKRVIGFTLVCKKITKEYYQFLCTIPNCYELAFLGISPCSQGCGLGSRLLKETLMTIFQKSTQFTCWLVVDKINVSAMQLYKKFGFRQWAETQQDSTLVPGYIMGVSHRRFKPMNQ